MSSRHITAGILAHVDAGKTTLSESLLYLSGKIQKQGRVDHKDAYLDTWQLEKDRGITIFSKQAELSFGGTDGLSVTLLDTPGHIDFSPETERVLQVLDYAILVISAADGVTGQVRNLWNLLAHYRIPTFLFVNKMDQPGADTADLLRDIRDNLGSQCVDFTGVQFGPVLQIPGSQAENIAVCDDRVLEHYLETEEIREDDLRIMIRDRKLFPVFFGSALRNEGVSALMRAMDALALMKHYPDEFGARIFKISRDDSGNRLTWMKITGGSLRVRSVISVRNEDSTESSGENTEQKVNQIRIYSGKSFVQVPQVDAGFVCAVTGPDETRIGMGLGFEHDSDVSVLQPVWKSRILLAPDQDRAEALRNLRVLEEEEPLLHIDQDDVSGEISARIMGKVQMEILRELCAQRFGMRIDFAQPSIMYKETIADSVEGVGHYEPLRHYAEVHLLMEPGEPGSGLVLESDCSTDDLALNWQRLILSHLEEQPFPGVLTGSEITDIKITVIGGRASEKHTSGGDFRQATHRAVRQGLMMAKNVLLEPVLRLHAELPSGSMGRFMTDIQRMEGSADLRENDGTTAIITGSVPAAAIGDYQQDFMSYTHGHGRLSLTLRGYEPCRHSEEVILEKGYDPEADTDHPSSSVFCSHGAGIRVPWDQVRDYMHIDTGWRPDMKWLTEEDQALCTDSPKTENTENTGGKKIFSAGWQKKHRTKEKSWTEEQRTRENEENELQQIFEKTYSGSSWNTPIHSVANSYSNETGIWSRDGSLEKAERDRTEKNKSESSRTAAVKSAGEQTSSGKNRRSGTSGAASKKEDYLLVDGYNIIFSWEELRSLAASGMDAARDRLIDILSNFHGTRSGTLILVFDAYKVPGGRGAVCRYHNIYVVYTKEAETADAYIEKTVHKIGKQGNVTVATSDGLEQVIIFGEGARRMSARELLLEVEASRKELRSSYHL
ncbi:NYN domain-containing protein [Bilifractor sp. HCP3S3_D3]|uniref:NYN domain-containing protein n=1 Tax=Bilifractor sp. HCP3S3_D3 TaxID=3438907 RepID=UPI003F891EB0